MRAAKYSEQMTLKEIGEELDMSPSYVAIVLRRAIAKFRRGCERRGINADDILFRRGSMLAAAELWADDWT